VFGLRFLRGALCTLAFSMVFPSLQVWGEADRVAQTRAYAERFGVPTKGKAFRALLQRISKEEAENEPAELPDGEYDYDPGDEPRPVVRHFVTPQGIPFEEENAAPQKVKFPLGNVNLEELQAKLNSAQVDFKSRLGRAPAAPPPLEMCLFDKTIQEDQIAPTDSPSEGPLLDYLYIERKDLPEDPHRYFGKSTIIYLFDSNPMNPVPHMARGMGVPCLPFRLRGTSRYIFRHEGRPALLNYDENLDGEGVRVRKASAEAKSEVAGDEW